jgi:hypothetical protein
VPGHRAGKSEDGGAEKRCGKLATALGMAGKTRDAFETSLRIAEDTEV